LNTKHLSHRPAVPMKGRAMMSAGAENSKKGEWKKLKKTTKGVREQLSSYPKRQNSTTSWGVRVVTHGRVLRRRYGQEE